LFTTATIGGAAILSIEGLPRVPHLVHTYSVSYNITPAIQGETVMSAKGTLVSALQTRRQEIRAKWLEQLERVAASAKGRLSSKDLAKQADDFLNIVVTTAQTQGTDDINTEGWQPARVFLEDLSRQRVLAGFSSDETATFIFSLKRPIFDALRQECGNDAENLAK
jgi:hypothetical protein